MTLGRAVLGLVLIIITTILILIATQPAGAYQADETLCADPDTGEPGLLVVDRCYTAAIYDELYAPSALEAVGSLSIPGRSVAEVYSLGSESPAVPASERPRVFMGHVEPSYAELLERAEEAADNPAFR